MELEVRKIKTIPLIKPDLPSFDILEDAFREVVENGSITNFGKYVRAFEGEAGAYLGTEVATVSSGTMGLLMTLQALGLRPGQKVIVPSFTFMATVQAILYAGGVPVFAEIGDDLTISVPDLECLLTTHDDVGMVMPVHMYGLPCGTEAIARVVESAGRLSGVTPPILYDAAHAFGSAVAGQKVGGFGSAEVFSLSVTKILVSVEGGMVSSHDPDLIERVRRMRNYGIKSNYNAHWPGLNGKMSEFHAIVGLHNLRRLDALMAERQQKARYYLDAIRVDTAFDTLPWPDDVIHTFKDLTVLVPEEQAGARDAIMESLKARGIETRAYFYPPAHQQAYFAPYADRPLPRTESLARRVITLPFFTSISEEEMDYVVDALRVALPEAAGAPV